MGDPLTGLREALADRYRIERELGRGGMATVYLAQDLRHDRPVALKVLHPQLGATLGPERFQREIRLAARLQHPHILSVLDSGTVPRPSGGPELLWFTMPYVEGESLRDRLTRERQLPVADAVRIAREAAEGLDYAHRHGVIHRDVKPENILLSEGHALVADFGIARALGGGDERLTSTGLTVGTPAYMSPEQAAGARELDARSDLYSLGLVLYEMLAGEPPFAGATPQAAIARRMVEVPRPIRELRETVPPSVEEALTRALARAPADRFATAAELARALEAGSQATTSAARPATSSAPVAAAPVAPSGQRRIPSAPAVVVRLQVTPPRGMLIWQRAHRSVEDTGTGPKFIAVLPFENLGPADQQYFADGVTDAVRGKLTGLPGLQVIASNSSDQYKGTGKTPQQIGQELGVQYLVVGKVRWEKSGGGSRVQVSPELIQVSSGTARWQQPFNAAITDVFQVQADIAGSVAEALNLALGTGEREARAQRPTRNLGAYDAFLKAEEVGAKLGNSDLPALRQAQALYEQAVALDSGFVSAWAQLSRLHSVLYYNGSLSVADARAALAEAQRAAALAPDAPESHLALGDYYNSVIGDFARAMTSYSAGLRLAPTNAALLTAAGIAEQSLGRADSALARFRQAAALDPRSVIASRRLARAYLWLRRYPEAIAECDRAMAFAPENSALLQNRVMVELAQGDLEGARALLRASRSEPTGLVAYFSLYWDLYWALNREQQDLALRLTPSAFDDNRGAWGLVQAQIRALHGDQTRARVYADSARQALEAAVRDNPDDSQSLALLGVALAYQGRTAEAIATGERAVRMVGISRDAYGGPYNQLQLVRIYLLAGDTEKALDLLEPLLRIPFYLSPGWLRVDPNFDPIRKDPRFERLVGGG
jgi:serine/threonine protein kinase/tetratricopeptide (TPR) repeat protein